MSKKDKIKYILGIIGCAFIAAGGISILVMTVISRFSL